MSTVNKYNYEAVLLDFAEGRLSASETDALFDFLAAHPELQEDFDAALEMFTLQENESIVFAAKDKLLQDETFGGMQDLIIANLENVASKEEKEALAALLENNKAVQDEFTVFSKMKLEADESVVFTRKEGLVQTQTVSFATWIYRASYAAAAIVLMLLAFNNIEFGSSETQVGLASNVRPRFEFPERILPKNELIQPNVLLPNQRKERQNQNTVNQNSGVEQYASVESIAPMMTGDLRDIELHDLSSNAELAEFVAEPYENTNNQDASINFIERLAQESNVVNVGYGFADAMTKKFKVASKEYAEKDYIELKFWKVHTQIRKPSWMKLNRR